MTRRTVTPWHPAGAGLFPRNRSGLCPAHASTPPSARIGRLRPRVPRPSSHADHTTQSPRRARYAVATALHDQSPLPVPHSISIAPPLSRGFVQRISSPPVAVRGFPSVPGLFAATAGLRILCNAPTLAAFGSLAAGASERRLRNAA